MTRFQFFLASSLSKVLPNQKCREFEEDGLRGFLGETISIQLAYSCENGDFGESDRWFLPQIQFDVPEAIRVRKVELVTCNYPCHGTWDEDYLSTVPGLYPDLLVLMGEEQPVKAVPAQWRSLWIDITVCDIAFAGQHNLRIDVADIGGKMLEQFHVPVTIYRASLPKQELIHTEWFHADCLADYYHVPVFGEEHWRVIDHFMESAVRHGINMLLTPVFTPPLDTEVGGERTTVQLVGVKKDYDRYSFDFSNLRRWIGLCEKNGICYLEMAHLFTQWGAVCAPKIIASVDGGPEEKLFGWHTPAVGGEYTRFLHAFLPALKDFLAEGGWLENTYFHISDEPHDNEVETFAAAKEAVAELLAGCKVVDALSSFAIYHEGYVERPVASVDCIAPFLEAGVPHLWTYYCTCQAIECTNRFIAMPGTRNRILGTLLYYFNIEGFLHWGFNFYNTQRSTAHINPYCVTDAGESFPSGDPFLVYPAPDGTAYESIRGMVLRQALCDLRALQLVESACGRERVCELVKICAGEDITFKNYPRTEEFFSRLRKAVEEAMNLA